MIQLYVIPSCVNDSTQIVELFEHLLPNVSISVWSIYDGSVHYIVDMLSISMEAVDFVIKLKNSPWIYTFKNVCYEISLK
jgi:hypothetical protein